MPSLWQAAVGRCDLPDGQTHVKIWKSLSPLTFIAAIIVGLGWSWYIALWVVMGWGLHGLGIDPDLDIEGETRSEALWMDLIVPIPLIGWSALYARMFRNFGGHRSVWTHGFAISSLIRLLFFGFPFVWLFRRYFLDDLVREFIGMWIGLSISDAWHTLADMITGEVRWGGHRFGGSSRHLKNLMKLWFDYPRRKS